MDEAFREGSLAKHFQCIVQQQHAATAAAVSFFTMKEPWPLLLTSTLITLPWFSSGNLIQSLRHFLAQKEAKNEPKKYAHFVKNRVFKKNNES